MSSYVSSCAPATDDFGSQRTLLNHPFRAYATRKLRNYPRRGAIVKKDFPICDALAENPARFCAALAVAPTSAPRSRQPQFSKPSEKHRSGTLTFVTSGGRSFGITCWHVIETLRKANSETGKQHQLRTMLNGFYVVLDRFVRPNPPFGAGALDIAIRELSPEFAKALGKEQIQLDDAPDPAEITFGYAVGFPENLKRRLDEKEGHRVAMPQCEVTAKIERQPERRFSLFSQVQRQDLAHEDFSGMSGGPIFWSEANRFGIYGIVYEGGVTSASKDFAEIFLYGELATPSVIRGWIQQVNPLKFD